MIYYEYLLLERQISRLFNKGIADYNLLEPEDHILIGVSGGKDSMALLDLLGKRAKIKNPAIKLEAIHVCMENIPYKSNLDYLKQKAESWNITLHLVKKNFNSDTKTKRSPCFLCSWNRRKVLFETAQKLGCNKIALGHHMDDILHTLLLNQLYEGQFSTMPVKLKMKKFPLTIIRPLCRISEKHLIKWSQYQKYPAMVKQCPFETSSRRNDIQILFHQMELLNPEVRYSLWNALEKEEKLIEL